MFIRTVTTLLAVFFCLNAGTAVANPDLTSAWEEYRYKNFGMAETGFKKVIDAREGVTDRDRLEAKIGSAMVCQYRLSGDDAAKALEIEKSVAGAIPAGDSLGALVHLLMGRACLRLDKPDPDGAMREFGWVIENFPSSISASEAILDLATMPAASPTKPNIEKVIQSIEKAIESRPGDQFSVLYYQIAGRYAMVIEEWERGRAHLMKALDIGLPNQRDLSTCLFQVAYVSDKYLQDPKTAIAYYSRLVNEVISDNRKSFCEERVAALKKELK